jgi:hypothetical protein
MDIILSITLLVAIAYLLLALRPKFNPHEPFYQETRDGSLHPVYGSEESI